MAVEAEKEPMKLRTDHGSRALALILGAALGCADDQGTTTVETTSGTDPGTTATEMTGTGADGSTGTTGTGTTVGVDDLPPWYGIWYALDPLTMVNVPEWWGNGGDSLGFVSFELRADGATMLARSCLWGDRQYEYVTVVDESGTVALEPSGGVHEFVPNGVLERLYPEPGADCHALFLHAVWEDGEETDFFSWAGGLKRGALCMQCAPTQGTQGVVSDCGTPVPWECPG